MYNVKLYKKCKKVEIVNFTNMRFFMDGIGMNYIAVVLDCCCKRMQQFSLQISFHADITSERTAASSILANMGMTRNTVNKIFCYCDAGSYWLAQLVLELLTWFCFTTAA